jgi:hypothetical protein
MGQSMRKKYIEATTEALQAKGFGKIKSRVAAEIAYAYFKANKLEDKTLDKLNDLSEEEINELKKEIDSGNIPEF